MANKALAFKDRDVRRLIRAARAEGVNPTVIEVDTKTGKIKVLSSAAEKPTADHLDQWLAKHADTAEGH